jgi:hypothetical protein
MNTVNRIWGLIDDMVERHNDQAEALAECIALVGRVLPDERPAYPATDEDLRSRPCLLCLLGTEHKC